MGFKHPEFLYALFAILIPVIIHLFNFRRYKKLWFSNIQFLKNITAETRKQNKLKHLVVLLLRILAIVAIVIAFAGPEMGGKDREIKTESDLTTIYIDNSYSAMAEGVNGRLFDQAVSQAREVVKIAPRDERFILQHNENSSGKRLLTKESMLAELDNLSISSSPKNMSAVMRSSLKSANDKGFINGNTYLLSDFQNNTFDVDDFPDDTSTNYFFVPLEHQQKRNIYIDSCWLTKPLVLAGKPVQLKIRVKNASEADLEKIPLKVFINDQQKAVAGVDLASKGEEEITVNFTLNSDGWQRGLIQIEDYPINFDDQLFFTFKVSNKINVLEIQGVEGDQTLTNFYSSDSIFNFQKSGFRKLDYNQLKSNHLIILNQLPEISSGLISQLKEYTSEGGNLFLIPGANNTSGDENILLQQFNSGRVINRDTSVTRVNTVNVQHDIFKDAITKISENASLPVIQQHLRISYPISSGVESLIVLLNGDDLFLKKDFGKGCFYMLTAPLGRDYGTLSSNALFVPMMYNVAFQGNSSPQLFYTMGNDDQISEDMISLPDSESPLLLKLYNSEYNFIPEQKISNGRIELNMHDGLTVDGFYELTSGDTIYHVFAFNYNRDESVMEFYAVDELNDLLSTSGISKYEVFEGDEKGFTEAISLVQKEGELWKLFIIFALLMLFAEVLILRFWKS